jgi:hypothetical protein
MYIDETDKAIILVLSAIICIAMYIFAVGVFAL